MDVSVVGWDIARILLSAGVFLFLTGALMVNFYKTDYRGYQKAEGIFGFVLAMIGASMTVVSMVL